jgi:hypothetical protein
MEPSVQIQEFERGQVVVEIGVLREKPQPPARRDVRGRPSEEASLARVGAQEREHHLEGGRLARAVGPEQSEDLSGVDGQIEPLDGDLAAQAEVAAKRLPETTKLDDRGHAERRSLFRDASRI